MADAHGVGDYCPIGACSSDVTACSTVDIVIGQTRSTKIVEHLREAPVGASTAPRFGRAAGEAPGPRPAVGAGHSFMVFLRDGFAVNVLNPAKSVPEVFGTYCAPAS